MDNLSKLLPYEIVCDILYKYKGLEHPTSKLIKTYFKKLDSEYNIYKHIEKITEKTFIKNNGTDVLITQKTEYKKSIRDYPRVYFPPDIDLIIEKIISNII
jgi:hypothetical protein